MADEDKKKSKTKLRLPNKTSTERLTGKMCMSTMKMRRMSYGFGAVAGIENAERSHMAPEFKRPPLLYISTYQLDPHPDRVFNVPRVTKLANNVLNSLWIDHKYNISETPALALRIADVMMRKVKNMNFNRYRIISVVTIGQKRAQSYNNAISFLWDHERDNYVDVHRECTSNFIQVTIFGIYLD